METFCLLGNLPGTPLKRYGIVRGGSIVSVLVSKPEGQEIPPDGLRWKVTGPRFDVTPEFMNPQQFTYSTKNGQQARTSWRRGARAGAV